MQAEEDTTCPGCGQPKDESMAKGNDDAYETTLYACFACAAIERTREQARDGGDIEPGIHISVSRKTEAR